MSRIGLIRGCFLVMSILLAGSPATTHAFSYVGEGGEADKALVQVENVLAECPELADAYTALAAVRRLQGDEEGAQSTEQRAQDLAGS